MSKSRVVKIINHGLYTIDDDIDPEQASKTINLAMTSLTGTNNPTDAWKSIVSPGDVFGIKPNCLAGKGLSSSPVVAQAIVDGLKSAGVKISDIIIWERSNRELEKAGYKLNYAGDDLKCYGTDTRGVDYGSDFHQLGKVASLLSRIYEDIITKNINFPVLKDHSLAGISAGMKNNYGIVHNPNKYHPDNCNPFAAEIAALAIVKKKNVLTICDMTRAQYQGGPGYMPNYLLKPGGVIVSFDPVAIDLCCYKIIDKYRLENGLKSLKDSGREPVWIKNAAELGLGQADFSEIEFIEKDIS
jgi:uncharacterized protein (DUF362 family)